MKAYYNENDPGAAAWLRELIKAGVIAPGEVDERSIKDVKPDDLKGYTQTHFFAGIGGWSYALRLAGVPDDFACWTGSCPCQPFSMAGKRKGTDDARHLWPDFRRLIADCDPAICFGEQVASKDGREWLSRVRTDLETLGYAVGAADLCAAGCRAPHIRQRLWWVADARRPERNGRTESVGEHRGTLHAANRCGDGGLANSENQDGGPGVSGVEGQAGSGRDRSGVDSAARGLGNANGSGLSEQCGPVAVSPQQSSFELRGNPWDSFDLLPCRDGKSRRIEPGTFPLAHGISGRVGKLRGYGNAIVPQVAAKFIKAFVEAAQW